ncbi:MAG: transcriptional regulator [Treponema sp.]|nr:transcriptional regulator [Treponema sp.]
MPATGSSSNSLLSILGFGDTPKDILLTIVPESAEQSVRQAIQDECQNRSQHRGVIFSLNVPCFIKSGSKNNLSAEEKSMSNEKFQMINIIMNKGYAEDAMAAARKAGASGGTVLNGRGTAKEGDAKFFGVEIVPEKEMLIILAPTEKTAQIIEAINSLACFSKDGNGIIFTADATGFSLLGKK